MVSLHSVTINKSRSLTEFINSETLFFSFVLSST